MRSLDPTDPTDIGGYRLLARLGAGGMGQVFLSRTPSGRPLALKTVRPELGVDPGFEERFAREIVSSDRVRSPWAVAVVDYSPPGHRPQWLATEYVAAPSLADWVRSHGPLPEPAVRALAAELAEGLSTVHRAGLAHRDVKPSNVLLARRHPLLIDFGIARAADDVRHTRTGGVVGSPGYMAPEQVTGEGSAEPGDIFCLGAVLVYAATGAGPFLRPGEDPSAARLLYRIAHEEPVLDGVPASLLPLLAACLHKSPRERPTAQALLEHLGSTAPGAGGPGDWVTAPPPGLDEELAAREAELRALLERSPAFAAPRDAVPPATVPSANVPSASMPMATVTPGTLPPLAVTPTAPLVMPAAASAPAAAPPGPGPSAGFGPPYAYGPPAAPPTGPPTGPTPARGRAPRARTVAVVAGVVAVAAVVAALSWPDGDSVNSSGGRSGSSPPPSRSGARADALPASWVGTWKGTGPGSKSADGVVNSRTSDVTVVVTLHGAARGELVGRQVSHVTEAGSGRDVGCTETLRLREPHRNSMVFEAATSTPTDPSAGVVCVRGNLYTLTKTGADTLRLGNEGSQTAGSPSRLTRSS
ncbi:serine/threonine-protein kinase [Streptomyces olivochromogenes]|uniref:serine/threonine-protein kinase n=1 Tax=Streptomyces olivochromogenes TaxID=1963 RepID=UPI001F3BC72A|nr:serine/threonine-protein kinase [Streptomyces olivochromogenes]MCF3130359.1 serine/threonine protein kinase [Streptomyces olivochromogenes]